MIEAGQVKHTEVEIPLGASRYGGPVVDLPPGEPYPAGLHFAAQLDLALVAPHDRLGLLPTSGQLIVFADIGYPEKGKVIYHKVSNEELIRTTVMHDRAFYDGVLIEAAYAEKEQWSEKFRPPDDGAEERSMHKRSEPGVWDESAGHERSKLFGTFTHCQWSRREVEGMIKSDKVVLLQFGENGFNDEGLFTVTIRQKDLLARNFGRCEYYWSQS